MVALFIVVIGDFNNKHSMGHTVYPAQSTMQSAFAVVPPKIQEQHQAAFVAKSKGGTVDLHVSSEKQ